MGCSLKLSKFLDEVITKVYLPNEMGSAAHPSGGVICMEHLCVAGWLWGVGSAGESEA